METSIEHAGTRDIAEVDRLLEENHLPVEGWRERLAQQLGVPAIYLLTTTAERFFPKFGFEKIMRAEVPATVQTSIEFTSACPASATVMRKQL